MASSKSESLPGGDATCDMSQQGGDGNRIGEIEKGSGGSCVRGKGDFQRNPITSHFYLR